MWMRIQMSLTGKSLFIYTSTHQEKIEISIEIEVIIV
jgi:hypothetical protein